MRTTRLMTSLALCLATLAAQGQDVNYHPFKHYTVKVEEFKKARPIGSADIVMLGDSETEFGGDWNKLLNTTNVVNRGIAGDDAMGVYHRLSQVLPGKPKAIFLMIGTNDLSHDLSATQVAELVEKLIRKIRTDAPDTRLFVQSLLPINESFGRWKTLEGKTDVVPEINRLLCQFCEKEGIEYIDLFPKFVRHGTNILRKELTSDGLHLTRQGYKIWAFHLGKYIKSCTASDTPSAR